VSGVCQEWLERIASQIRAGGDGVRSQHGKCSSSVRLRSGGNIASLGIQDDGYACRDGCNDLSQCFETLSAVNFEEGGVRFESSGRVGCSCDHSQAEIARRRSGWLLEFGRVWVKSDA